jgi:hypothetical protein
MLISTLDISRITTAVRRHEALLRFVRYLLIYDLAMFLWAVVSQSSKSTSFEELPSLIASLSWGWAFMVLGSLGAAYLLLAHRLWWAYAVILLGQVVLFLMPSSDKTVLQMSALTAYGVITQPRMRPLAPLATNLAIMTIGFFFVMIICCVYSVAWAANARRVPPAAYGRRLSLFEPLRSTRLLDTLLPGHRSLNVTRWEAALFALSSMLFVAASMATFGGFRRVQNAMFGFASQVQQTCIDKGITAQFPDALVACMAQLYPWSRAAIDLGAPIVIAAACLVLANRLRHLGRRHFVHRLSELPISPAHSTLFLRPFRDDQTRIRRASRNLFSTIFDLGRVPATLDELMLERLNGRGDLIAIGNPQDRKGAARRSPWGAQRLYVDDAQWQRTVSRLARDADRIVLCIDASDGVRWEIAHVLRNGYAAKTLFFLNPEIDVQTRTRLLTEDFGISATDLTFIKIDRILALRATLPGQTTLILCAKPERDAYLVMARLAFEDTAAERSNAVNAMCPATNAGVVSEAIPVH